MPFGTPELRKLTARAGQAARYGRDDADDLRRELATERIAAYAAKVLAEAPPLTPAQRDRLVVLLREEAA